MTPPETSPNPPRIPDDFVFPNPIDYERERANAAEARAEAAEARVRELEKLLRNQQS